VTGGMDVSWCLPFQIHPSCRFTMTTACWLLANALWHLLATSAVLLPSSAGQPKSAKLFGIACADASLRCVAYSHSHLPRVVMLCLVLEVGALIEPLGEDFLLTGSLRLQLENSVRTDQGVAMSASVVYLLAV